MASQQFARNILSICAILQKRGVQYLLVGGTVVAFHGYVRPTTNRDGTITDRDDFDFWYNPRYFNYLRLIGALEDLGLDMADVRKEELVNLKNSFFRHHFEDFTIDFIPTVGGNLMFRDCYERRLVSTIGETDITVLSLPDLLVSKKAAGRKKRPGRHFGAPGNGEKTIFIMTLHKKSPSVSMDFFFIRNDR